MTAFVISRHNGDETVDQVHCVAASTPNPSDIMSGAAETTVNVSGDKGQRGELSNPAPAKPLSAHPTDGTATTPSPNLPAGSPAPAIAGSVPSEPPRSLA